MKHIYTVYNGSKAMNLWANQPMDTRNNFHQLGLICDEKNSQGYLEVDSNFYIVSSTFENGSSNYEFSTTYTIKTREQEPRLIVSFSTHSINNDNGVHSITFDSMATIKLDVFHDWKQKKNHAFPQWRAPLIAALKNWQPPFEQDFISTIGTTEKGRLARRHAVINLQNNVRQYYSYSDKPLTLSERDVKELSHGNLAKNIKQAINGKDISFEKLLIQMGKQEPEQANRCTIS